MRRRLFLACAAVAVMAVVSAAAAAQGSRNAADPGPFPGFGQTQKRDQPIHIEATTLEVRDKSKIATFSGNVIVVQGDTTIRCRKLAVFYGEQDGAAATKTAEPGDRAANTTGAVPENAHDISRIEARGDVIVASKDQKATGDLGIYDLKSHTITLTGNVMVSQGKNVVRGDRVIVDTITGIARVESTPTTPGRVRALIVPQKSGNAGPSNIMTFAPQRPN